MDASRITPEDVQSRLERGEDIVFVDTRSDKDWQESNAQIPGSVRSLATEITRHLDEIPAEVTVVTYCS